MNNRKQYWRLRATRFMMSRKGLFLLAALPYASVFAFFLHQNPNWFRAAVSKDVEALSNVQIPSFLRNPIYSLYCLIYDVEKGDLLKPLNEYKNFMQFFTRRIKARKVNQQNYDNALVSPVDGTILKLSRIESLNSTEAVKGVTYSIGQLLWGEEWTKKSQPLDKDQNLYQAIIYLAPGDYHRFHAPLAIKLLNVAEIGNCLFPVNTRAVHKWGGRVYEQNVRKVLKCEYSSGTLFRGEMYMVMVGAMNVSNIRIKNKEGKDNVKSSENYVQGEELGYFALGSTIVMIIQTRGQLEWLRSPHEKVRYGEAIARFIPPH